MKEIINKGLKYSLANPQEFAAAYKEAFGEVVCSYCPGVIQEKFNKLLNTTEEKLITMKNRKWRMKPGKIIDTLMSKEGPWGQWTDKNITDEIAEKLIAKGYGERFLKNDSEAIEIEEPVGNIEGPAIVEEEINFEVHERLEPGSETQEAKKDSFDTYQFSKLVKYCKTKGFPESEWENKNRKDLITYVRSK
jgi:hypothetical protein